MAVTLSEAAKFTTNMVKRGVLETIIKDTIVLQKLPFIDVVGNAYQYLQENSIGSANFYDPNEPWIEQTPTFTQKTANIRIMGGDADVDEFLKATRSDKTDLEAEVIQARAKGIKHTFLDKFWYGSNSTNSKEFDGVHVLMPAAQMVHAGSGSTGAAPSAAAVDAALDLVLDGPPDCIVVNRQQRRRIRQYLRSKGAVQGMGMNEYTSDVTEWGGVKVYIDDFITQTETISSGAYSAKTGGATTTYFFLRFGSNDLVGLQNGGLQIKRLGQLESKDAMRTRIKWYCAVGLMRDLAIADYDGVTDAVMTD
jgi:hypothetical protein